MTANTPAPNPFAPELGELLNNELPQAEDRGQRHAALRLQPVVLQPPPDETASGKAAYVPSFPSVSAEDDILTDREDERRAKNRQLLFLGAGLAVAIVGGLAYLVLGRGEKEAVSASIPVIRADPASQAKAPPPPEASPPLPGQSGDKSMGDISTELFPPSTEGLSPARRISTIRIVVQDDREIVKPR